MGCWLCVVSDEILKKAFERDFGLEILKRQIQGRSAGYYHTNS